MVSGAAETMLKEPQNSMEGTVEQEEQRDSWFSKISTEARCIFAEAKELWEKSVIELVFLLFRLVSFWQYTREEWCPLPNHKHVSPSRQW